MHVTDANMHVPAPSMHVTEIAHVNMVAILACMFKTPTWHLRCWQNSNMAFQNSNMVFQNSNIAFQNSEHGVSKLEHGVSKLEHACYRCEHACHRCEHACYRCEHECYRWDMHVTDVNTHVTDVNMINTSLFAPSKKSPHCLHHLLGYARLPSPQTSWAYPAWPRTPDSDKARVPCVAACAARRWRATRCSSPARAARRPSTRATRH